MASDYSEFIVLLDRSGSMQSAKSDHEGGLRSFVQDQRDLERDVRFTLIQFDDHNPCEVVYDGAPIGDVGDITLVPRGGTPLLDAIGKAIAHAETRLGDAQPDQVVLMVITDGQENASREFTKQAIAARIAEKETAGWKVLYLGANVDEFAEAGGLGIARGSTLGYSNDPHGTRALYATVSTMATTER